MFKKEEKTSHFETIFKLTIVILAIAIVFFLPFYWYYKYQGQGIAMYLVLIVFTSPLIKYTFDDFLYFKKNEISNAILNLKTLFSFLFILNVITFFTFGFKTLISISHLFLLYLITYLPAIIENYQKQKLSLLNIAITLCVSVFLIFNFKYSSNPRIEKYLFYNVKENGQKFYLIILEGNKYDKYIGIRAFIDVSEIKGHYIDYTIKEGFFGLEVVDSYKFNY